MTKEKFIKQNLLEKYDETFYLMVPSYFQIAGN